MVVKEKKSPGGRARHLHETSSHQERQHQKRDTMTAPALVLASDGSADDDIPTKPRMLNPNDTRVSIERRNTRTVPVIENEAFVDLEDATAQQEIRHEARPLPESRASNRSMRSERNAVPCSSGRGTDTENGSTPLNRTIAARLVNTIDLDRIVDQGIQRALEEERQHTAVAQILAENAEFSSSLEQVNQYKSGRLFLDPNEWLIPFCVAICGPRGRLLAVIGAVFSVASIIAAIIYISTRDYPPISFT